MCVYECVFVCVCVCVCVCMSVYECTELLKTFQNRILSLDEINNFLDGDDALKFEQEITIFQT